MLFSDRVKTFWMASAVVALLYVISHGVVGTVITPVQAELIPDVTKYASFFYLPHGVRVIATAVLGAAAIPALIVGEVVGNFLFWDIADPTMLLVISVIGGILPWLGFELLRSFGISAYYLHTADKMPPLRMLLLAGFVASLLNGFVLTAIFEHSMEIGNVTQVMAAYVVGDMTGFLLVIILIKIWLRFLPLSFRD